MFLPSSLSTLRLICLSVLSTAVPVHANTQYSSTPGSCEIIGDPDVYGIGIRLSYYLQWASVLLAIWIAPDSANKTRTATNIVTICVFINSFRGAAVEDSLMVVEWYIVQYLALWLLVLNLPTSERALRHSVGSVAVMLLNMVAAVVMGQWSAFHVKLGAKDGCEPNLFPSYGQGAYETGSVVLGKVTSIFFALVGILPLVAAVKLLWLGLWSWNGSDDKDSISNEDKKEERLLSYMLRGIWTLSMAITGAVFISFVEQTIQINGVVFPDSSITDSGQLIPLLIGIFTVASVGWEGLRKLIGRLK